MAPSKPKPKGPIQVRNARPHNWLKSNPKASKTKSNAKTSSKKNSN